VDDSVVDIPQLSLSTVGLLWGRHPSDSVCSSIYRHLIIIRS